MENVEKLNPLYDFYCAVQALSYDNRMKLASFLLETSGRSMENEKAVSEASKAVEQPQENRNEIKGQFSWKQRESLMRSFEKSIFADEAEVQRLEEELGITKKQIYNWFYRRRRMLNLVGPNKATFEKDAVPVERSQPATVCPMEQTLEQLDKADLNPIQLKALQQLFQIDRNASKGVIVAIATMNDISLGQALKWFQDEREKMI